ncbi:MAG TPA: PKD domain-containing protein, partial [Phaeodactylibacter sp.]|nr:PKD domain-containing protein [Phaeodactylibacter sp.]
QAAPASGFYPGDTLLTLEQGSAELAFTDTSQNAVSYLWDFGDGQTSGESNPVHTYTDAGSYAVTQWVFGAGGCSSAAIGRVEVQWPVAVAEAGEEALEVRVFPNPTQGEVVWSFSGPLPTEVIWRLYDLTGRLQAEEAIPPGRQTWAYSLQHLPKGMYYWVCLSPSGKYRSGSVFKY